MGMRISKRRSLKISKPMRSSKNTEEAQKKRKQHEKELKSFRNKMGSNIIWFDSLSKTKQYDLLFSWKRSKFINNRTAPEYVIVSKKTPLDPLRPWGRKKITKVKELRYPASLKHFIIKCKDMREYKPNVIKVRENTIDLILNQK
jgi:hypothetical protein